MGGESTTTMPLRSLLKKTSSLTGLEFIESSSFELACEFGASIVFITRLSSSRPGWVDVLAGTKNGHPMEPWSFNLKGTPCEGIYATYNPAVDARDFYTGVVKINSRVSERFLPAKPANAQGFLGIPLWNEECMIGHLAIFFEEGIGDSFASEAVEICLLFSQRIQAELMRLSHECEISNAMQKLLVANRKLRAQSIHDPLTGLLTRRAMKDTWKTLASSEAEKIVFAIGDIDKFKCINDSFGHDRGDEVLREFGRRLRRHFHRKTDMLFRLGGEEFAVLLARGDESAASIYKLLLKVSRYDLSIPNKDIHVTASWGLVESSETEYGLVYKEADSLLYKAKENGRNCIASNAVDTEYPLIYQI